MTLNENSRFLSREYQLVDILKFLYKSFAYTKLVKTILLATGVENLKRMANSKLKKMNENFLFSKMEAS